MLCYIIWLLYHMKLYMHFGDFSAALRTQGRRKKRPLDHSRQMLGFRFALMAAAARLRLKGGWALGIY